MHSLPAFTIFGLGAGWAILVAALLVLYVWFCVYWWRGGRPSPGGRRRNPTTAASARAGERPDGASGRFAQRGELRPAGQTLKRLGFQLLSALTGDAEPLAGFGQRLRSLVARAEAQLDDVALALGERGQGPLDRLAAGRRPGRLLGSALSAGISAPSESRPRRPAGPAR